MPSLRIVQVNQLGISLFAATPLSSSTNIEMTNSTNNSTNGLASNVISADSSVASSVSLDEEEEPLPVPIKVSKKKDEHSKKVS